jgi:hypothetical protein
MLSVEKGLSVEKAGGARGMLAGERMRVAIVCDLIEENWPSMELVADMLCGSARPCSHTLHGSHSSPVEECPTTRIDC